MMEILKKHAVPTGVATVIVLAITFVPIWYQWKQTAQQNARIAALEEKVKSK